LSEGITVNLLAHGACGLSQSLPRGVEKHCSTQLATPVIVTRPDERGEQKVTLHSGSLNGSDTPVL